MSFREVRLTIRRNFGSTRNFIIWLILLGIVLYIFNYYIGNEHDLNSRSITELPATTYLLNKHSVKKRCDADAIRCPTNSYSFLITSGEGKTYHPAICFNGDFILNVDKNNSRRGINVAVINDKTLDVEDVRIFDTYTSDTFFKTYFSTLIPSNFIVLIASFDDITYSLSDESRVLLESFGSNSIKEVKFRDSFVMLGQKNLKRGQSVEKLTRSEVLEYAGRAEIKGCTKVPVGQLETSNAGSANKKKSDYKRGEALINCGVSDVCDDTSFSFHAYSGDGRDDLCKLCVNGKYIFAKNLNSAGRGFNVAVVSPMTRDVIKVGVFDTYASEGTNAEIFLEMLNDKDIVIAVTFDDASKMLTVNVQKFFEELGSVMINRLSFRDSWVFVGQKGISGVSPIEKMNRADDGWPTPIDFRMCVPIQLEKIKPGMHPELNLARKRFCEDHKGTMNDQFCAAENQLKFFQAATFMHPRKHLLNDIYRTPIIIIPGSNYHALQLQMDNLLSNPGIRLDMINLIHSSKHRHYTQLAEVYGIRSHSIFTHEDGYEKFFPDAFRRAWSLYINENHLIFLEEEVIPTSAFLSFLAHCTNTNYYIDNSLVGISTWNPYGGVGGLAEVWYRTNAVMPGLGFLMKRLFYMNYINDAQSLCCSGRSWLGWKIQNLDDKEIILPSVSRSYRLPVDSKLQDLGNDTKTAHELFNDSNYSVNKDFDLKLRSPGSVLVHKYEAYVRELILSSGQFGVSEVNKCITEGIFSTPTSLERISIYYEQQGVNDMHLCLTIASCFDYHPIPRIQSPYLRNGVLRLTHQLSEVFLIGSKTDAFKLKPESAPVYKMLVKLEEESKLEKHEDQSKFEITEHPKLKNSDHPKVEDTTLTKVTTKVETKVETKVATKEVTKASSTDRHSDPASL